MSSVNACLLWIAQLDVRGRAYIEEALGRLALEDLLMEEQGLCNARKLLHVALPISRRIVAKVKAYSPQFQGGIPRLRC